MWDTDPLPLVRVSSLMPVALVARTTHSQDEDWNLRSEFFDHLILLLEWGNISPPQKDFAVLLPLRFLPLFFLLTLPAFPFRWLSALDLHWCWTLGWVIYMKTQWIGTDNVPNHAPLIIRHLYPFVGCGLWGVCFGIAKISSWVYRTGWLVDYVGNSDIIAVSDSSGIDVTLETPLLTEAPAPFNASSKVLMKAWKSRVISVSKTHSR